MLKVERREQIRRAYYIEKKSMRQIGEELRHSYWTIRAALDGAEVSGYQLQLPKRAPVLGRYKGRLEELHQAGRLLELGLLEQLQVQLKLFYGQQYRKRCTQSSRLAPL